MWYTNVIVLVLAFIGMESVAWFTHKYIMHGLLWFLHSDHHRKVTDGFLEKNDFFFLFFAIPGIICIYSGFETFNPVFFAGIGITLYGFTYFMVHDVIIHQRIKFIRKLDIPYFNAIRKAHKIHHKHLSKEDGECFGMLWIPFKYYREAGLIK